MLKRLLREDRGAINLVKIGIFSLVAAVLYFAWIFVPMYIDHMFGVKKVVRTACNVAYAARHEKPVRDSLLNGIKEMNMKDDQLSDDGTTVTEVPTPFDDDNITELDLELSPPQITVSIHYSRTVVWPFLKKVTTREFDYSHTEDLSAIKY